VPARLLGIDDRRGAIVEGLDAVLVIWEGEFEGVRQVLGA
jgi:N-acetylglucosamine-6-phosphate deacetylase